MPCALAVTLFAGQVRAGDVGGVGVALYLRERDRRARDPPVGEGDCVPGVFPSLVGQPVSGRPVVFDEAIAVGVAVPFDPLQGAVGVRQQGVGFALIKPPSPQLTEQHHEQRSRVGRAVVGIAAAECE